MYVLTICNPTQGLHGDTVLVEGVNTGTAKVQVRLVDRVWKVHCTYHFLFLYTLFVCPMYVTVYLHVPLPAGYAHHALLVLYM